MKICSKYKDFYDYLVQDHDADIIYVRNVGVSYDMYDELFDKQNINIPYYNSYYGYYSHNPRNEKDGNITFYNFIFGVYPYVYSQPVARVKYTSVTDYPEHIYIILSKQIVDALSNGNPNLLIDLANKEVSKVPHFKDVKCFVDYRDCSEYIRRFTWKVECKDIFDKLKSPVWTKFDTILYDGGAYWNYLCDKDAGKKRVRYVTNLCFSKLNMNILKYWYDDLNDLNTYINIENFLWSIKQEPISTPDNNTKILSHGFDLKTSFRKM